MTLQLPDTVRLVAGNGGLPRLDVSTRAATAEIYLHGAHVTAWQPAQAAAPVIWMSAASFFQPEKPIRGGVPICYPWFGPHPSDKSAPAHGFARLAEWRLDNVRTLRDGSVDLLLVLDPTSGSQTADARHAATVAHRITIGAKLMMSLEVRNPGPDTLTFEEALHTYFAVQDVTQIEICGLENVEYLDKVAGFARKRQAAEPIRFTAETDRVYLDTTGACTLDDPGLLRRIVVSKSGSQSTVVWNPWRDKAAAMPDFGNDEWRGMVCIETANVGDAAVRLEPGERHVMTAEISVTARTSA